MQLRGEREQSLSVQRHARPTREVEASGTGCGGKRADGRVVRVQRK